MAKSRPPPVSTEPAPAGSKPGGRLYVPTLAGFLYLAIVLDVFSRRIPAFAGTGWAMAGHLRTELVLDALDMAVEQRRPGSVIHHCDQGCQYTSFAFGERCRRWGVVPSMGSVGDCFDNAMAESFFATLECELLDRTHFHDHHQARRAIFEFIEDGITRIVVTGASVSNPRWPSRGATRKLQNPSPYLSTETGQLHGHHTATGPLPVTRAARAGRRLRKTCAVPGHP